MREDTCCFCGRKLLSPMLPPYDWCGDCGRTNEGVWERIDKQEKGKGFEVLGSPESLRS